MKYSLLILPFVLINNISVSQISVDYLLKEINNKDVYVSPVFGGEIIWKQDKSGLNYAVRADSNRRMFRVSTFDGDIRELAEKYSEKKVSLALYKLLSDSTRDFFASALLFELLDNPALGKFMNQTRTKWVENGRKDKDLKHWREVLVSKGYLEKFLTN